MKNIQELWKPTLYATQQEFLEAWWSSRYSTIFQKLERLSSMLEESSASYFENMSPTDLGAYAQKLKINGFDARNLLLFHLNAEQSRAVLMEAI